MPQAIAIGPARRDQLRPGAELLAASLGFAAADAVPAWLMQVVAEDAGGVALAAADGDELAGFSFALPALDGAEPFLCSCGLAVAPAFRGRGVGRALKLAQRRAALDRGFELIRWTADPLNGPGLRLYLSRLGARLVAYRAGLFDAVRPGAAHPTGRRRDRMAPGRPAGGGAAGRRGARRGVPRGRLARSPGASPCARR